MAMGVLNVWISQTAITTQFIAILAQGFLLGRFWAIHLFATTFPMATAPMFCIPRILEDLHILLPIIYVYRFLTSPIVILLLAAPLGQYQFVVSQVIRSS